ncbi:MAG TPA: UDP-N-acetylmuramoyl-L-alanyl-D-glutamate--2,6-diaminopimelate ligase [Candidatus Sumerlaeota bacterium]|nr:UDP-N-acetylmuramoyl-L-alanyl-D-glutamate--2,6-diaminopimelate ligase [Candidatus Sumerlaeota bacterium]HON51449.1 UDP-N-acetylmuramoyl-L-alanyl-D-glutamate--2,6-diaminopimelate ligase [Candidatus Sumerlaeota bacterium]HOR65343.1 UDP-N-acetylmuramoyl-L-alanyl-D-glutamate--2,6-diaminopimelate ligase [Candidatus Sumerlaeota bacterium]HPL74781.1 UDP-N-acetylmuramoyl-L-alanyl-D-glutamate--2,6-diaminopimelate ligase [Candidatus Sumerlaeota bacterium]HRU53619.1 UDP-N-acetylmuramoyl-L-alanyl-D-glut
MPPAIVEPFPPSTTHTPKYSLKNLLNAAGINPALCPPDADLQITGISDNSRRIKPGNIFVAVKGENADGHLFLSDAVDKQAAALIVERDIPAYPGVPVIRVPDTRDALALLAHAWYGNPSKKLQLYGLTGTNGKTTSTYILKACLEAAGIRTGLIGTIHYDVGGELLKAVNTTPSSLSLAEMFARMLSNGLGAAVMEVSSHAVHQRRIRGLEFNVGIFSNLTQDHIDYHGTMDAYRQTKWKFFEEYLAPFGGIGVFNLEDETGRNFASNYPGEKITYGMDLRADVYPVSYELHPRHTRISIHFRGKSLEICTGLIGRFNLMNILAASAGAMAAGISPEQIAAGISQMRPVPGRFEPVDVGQPFALIVDYAHTPDALERILASALDFSPRRIITIFGCGGNRDRAKRPLMAMAVGNSMMRNRGDFAIITNDNPRDEEPEAIAREAEQGFIQLGLPSERYEIILDRKSAIRRALNMAGKDDIVIIAGKGHEDYQIVGKNVLHFDDRETARELLKEMNSEPKHLSGE